MKRPIFIPPLVALAILGGLVLDASRAHAQPVDCTSLPNVVIGLGGSASRPLFESLAPTLLQADPPITLVYRAPGACFGIAAYVDGTPTTGLANYWNVQGDRLECTIPEPGVVPDFGMLGIKGTLCEGVEEIPDGIGEFAGPVTSWSLIANTASSQNNISAEAAYFVYGFGAEGQASPWTVAGQIFSRSATSAAGVVIARSVGLPPSALLGPGRVDVGDNARMVAEVTASANPEAAIGFVSTEYAELFPNDVKTLAFQATGQTCAYWPDSTPTARDKKNVRDGHYFLWSPYYFYAPVNDSGQITNARTRQFIGYFTGAVPLPPAVPLLDIIIENGNVPECAMNVWRDVEGGPLYSYQPDAPCGRYYDFQTTGETSCESCQTNDDCPSEAPTCRYNYCEVQ